VTDQSDSSREPISIAVAILAAGHGTRMNSVTPKHVHPVGGVPIVQRLIHAAQAIQPDHIGVVVSPSMMDLPERLGMIGEFQPVEMEVPTGTAHAVLKAIEALPDVDYIVSLLGDSPLLTGETVQTLVNHAVNTKTILTILTCEMDDASTYGRIDRDEQGRPTAIIEVKNDDPARRTGRTEINSGIMVLRRDWALDAIRRLPRDEGTGEYLLTDLVTIAAAEATEDSVWPVDTVQGPFEVSVGINTRAQQAEADSIVRELVRERHFTAGVSMVGPETIFIDESVRIGHDTTLLPGTILMGDTTIGSGCVIGPYAVLIDAEVEDNVTIRTSTVENSIIRRGADAGPYSHIRRGSDVGENVHIGNYVELKNTTMAPGSKSGHFSYLGDAYIGERSNIGAGSITANYDGERKHHTEIGEDVFVGCDSILVAPITIESTARTGAGSVVTKDVTAGQTVVGIPARPIKSSKRSHEE
jgi:bifunctional UDP-N-acetylglucosamine pyrophosphorylase / glucosamine-1-phosphate N-acetyltransferase